MERSDLQKVQMRGVCSGVGKGRAGVVWMLKF